MYSIFCVLEQKLFEKSASPPIVLRLGNILILLPAILKLPPTDSSSTENPPTETPDAPQEPEENNEN